MALSKCESQAARLTERVTFQEPSEAKNAVHEIISTWGDISTAPTVWAEIIPVTGKEYYEARQIREEKTVKITIRGRSDLSPKMRIVHSSGTYEIDYIPPYVRQPFMTLICHVTS